MPRFNLIPLGEAKGRKKRAGRKPVVLGKYTAYIEQPKLKPEMAGRLVLDKDEKAATVKARLYRAAKCCDVKLEIKMAENDVVLFWVKERKS